MKHALDIIEELADSRTEMRYSFDDMHIGKTESGRYLATREIERPPGLTNSAWYAFAGKVIKLLDK